MTSVALAVHDGTMLFETAAACEVFGVDRGITDGWYDFKVCAARETAAARVGGWLRIDAPHGLDDLAGADTVVVPSCTDVDAAPPADL
ncbi:AraC family transcriptional regulator, partial [Streptomyces sp. SID2131]|nr:AraC family transcriptional regulator [Streptomyces sp. SID2131]